MTGATVGLSKITRWVVAMEARQSITSGFHYFVWRRSPFPHGKHCDYTAILHCVADGELYAGTVSNFQGNEPIIYKSLSQGTSLKTENSLNWLQGILFGLESTAFVYIFINKN